MATDRQWDGGFIRKDSKGRDVYVIRKQIGGKRFDVSTRCHTSRAAHEQLKRFEADPENYDPAGGQGEALTFDRVIVAEFLTWSATGKKNSPAWVREQKHYLAWWREKLGACNLRRVRLAEDILPVLEGTKARAAKIRVIKTFFAWLVSGKRALTPDQDPTFRTLISPQAQPEQWARDKAITREAYLQVRAHLDGHWLDGLDVLAGTGWHVTEIVRFSVRGTVEAHPKDTESAILVCPQTKSGEILRTAVSVAVGKAGTRLAERGSFDPYKFADALRSASKAAGVKPHITPGRFRHSVATWAINAGADPAQVAAFLGHKSPRTTRKFYATHAVAARIPTLA